MMQPTNPNFFESSQWRTPATIEQQRFEWLQQQFRLMGIEFVKLQQRLDVIEQLLIEREAPPVRRHRRPEKVANGESE